MIDSISIQPKGVPGVLWYESRKIMLSKNRADEPVIFTL